MAAGAVMLVVALGGARPGASSPRANLAAEANGGTLRLAQQVDVDSVDPALAWEIGSWGIEFATCAKLFNYPDAAGAAGTRLVKEVVKEYTVSPDRRTYDFELKRTFRFHTGAPVTAQSFADAFKRDANPRQNSYAPDFMREIVGAAAVIDGKAKSISGVRVPGPYRLQIRLTRPVGDFTARLTMPFFCPILPGTPVDPNGIDDPPGSGPYYVAERVRNRQIVLKRNPFYRGGRPANVDQIVMTIGQSPDACLLGVEHDRIDYCGLFGLPPDVYSRLAKQYGVNRPGGQFFVNPMLHTAFLVFNHDRPAFKGPGQIALKKAINFALDRPALAATFGYLGSRHTDQILPPALAGDDRIYPLDGPNLARARKELANSDKPSTLVFYVRRDAEGTQIAQALRSTLKQLEINLDVKYYDSTSLFEKQGIRGEPFDLTLGGYVLDYADSASFFEVLLDPELRKKRNSNISYFVDLDVTARIDAASRLSGEVRRKAWADLDADLMRTNPPWAPILHRRARNFVSPSFSCFLYHPVYGVDLAAACKK